MQGDKPSAKIQENDVLLGSMDPPHNLGSPYKKSTLYFLHNPANRQTKKQS